MSLPAGHNWPRPGKFYAVVCCGRHLDGWGFLMTFLRSCYTQCCSSQNLKKSIWSHSHSSWAGQPILSKQSLYLPKLPFIKFGSDLIYVLNRQNPAAFPDDQILTKNFNFWKPSSAVQTPGTSGGSSIRFILVLKTISLSYLKLSEFSSWKVEFSKFKMNSQLQFLTNSPHLLNWDFEPTKAHPHQIS